MTRSQLIFASSRSFRPPCVSINPSSPASLCLSSSTPTPSPTPRLLTRYLSCVLRQRFVVLTLNYTILHGRNGIVCCRFKRVFDLPVFPQLSFTHRTFYFASTDTEIIQCSLENILIGQFLINMKHSLRFLTLIFTVMVYLVGIFDCYY